MAKFDSKVNGNTVDADEYNNLVLALKNTIEDSGQTVDAMNTQTSKAIANYAAVSDFYTDSGVANAYVLSTISNFKGPTAYTNGLKVRFRPGNDNTAAATVNVDSLGVKNIKNQDGATDVISGAITTDKDVLLRYDSSSDSFFMIEEGKVVQHVSTQTGAVATGTTTVPVDDTIPQNTEGDEYMTVSITPKNTNNKLLIDIVTNATHSATNAWLISSLFKDSDADALATIADFTNASASSSANCSSFSHEMIAGTTSSITFKVRIGADVAGTTTFNGQSGSRRFGGVMASSLRVTEIEA